MPVSADFNQVSNLCNILSWNFVGQVVAKTSLFLFHIIFADHVGAGSNGEIAFGLVGRLIRRQPALDLGVDQLISRCLSLGSCEVSSNSFRR